MEASIYPDGTRTLTWDTGTGEYRVIWHGEDMASGRFAYLMLCIRRTGLDASPEQILETLCDAKEKQ